MTGPRLTAPALLAHVFLRHGDDPLAPARPLTAVWSAVTRDFGLTEAIPALRVPARLAPGYRLAAGVTGLIAAAESGASSVWQASAWAGHGVLGVSVMLAPPRDENCADQWAGLEDRWDRALAAVPDTGLLGQARLFLALLAGGADDGAVAGSAAGLIRAAAPEPTAPGWWRRWDAVPPGRPDQGRQDEIALWELTGGPGRERPVRRLVCVAPARSEAAADQFLWTSGDGAPSPLTRHLAHAAGLRHQVGVYGDGTMARHVRDEIGRLVDDLPAVTAGGPDSATTPAGLAPALLRARASAISLRRRLTAMRHAVGILAKNLGHVVPLPAAAPGRGPLSDDLDLAAWFARRLDDEVTLVDEAAASAAAAAAFLSDAGAATPPAALRVVGSPGPPGRGARVVVVFTALGVEYQAIREYLDSAKRHEEDGTLYEVGLLPGVSGPWQVVLAETGPGSTAAGLQLDRAARLFEPEIALFLGVAGGRKDVALGDVVAADTIYDYESGKSTLEGFEPRIRTHQSAHRLLQWARLVARENRWQQRIRPSCPSPPPACFVKPIVTGAKVIAHDQSDTALLLRRYAGDAVAVETEGHGFLEGAYVNPRVDALVIRGISDLLTGKDKTADDYWQPAASRHAAAFAVEFLHSIGESET